RPDCVCARAPLAVPPPHNSHHTPVIAELPILLASSQPGDLVPTLRAERDLPRSRLADHYGDPDSAALFPAAIVGVREHGTPYHLAHGLLDHAQHLSRLGDADAAAAAAAEARGIAGRLRCQLLLDRAEGLSTEPGL